VVGAFTTHVLVLVLAVPLALTHRQDLPL